MTNWVVATKSADPRWDEVEVMVLADYATACRIAERLNLPAANDGYRRAHPYYVREE